MLLVVVERDHRVEAPRTALRKEAVGRQVSVESTLGAGLAMAGADDARFLIAEDAAVARQCGFNPRRPTRG